MTESEVIAALAEGGTIAELSAKAPANPFVTADFFEAQRQVGIETWMLGLQPEVELWRRGTPPSAEVD